MLSICQFACIITETALSSSTLYGVEDEMIVLKNGNNPAISDVAEKINRKRGYESEYITRNNK